MTKIKRLKRIQTIIAAAPVLAAISACSSSSSNPANNVSVVDSAGIQIVTNEDHGWGEITPWTLTQEPKLSIGEFDGEEEYQLFRVVGALKTDEGNIVVANAGSFELRIYDENGLHIRSSGREGGGPGEFERMATMRRYHGDSLLTVEFGVPGKYSVFSQTGDFGRSSPTAPPNAGFLFAFLVGSTNDGRLLINATAQPTMDMGQGVTRLPTTVLSVNPNGENLDTIGTFPSMEFYRGDTPMSVGQVPFGLSLVNESYENGVVIGTTETYELRVFDIDSGLTKIVRKSHVPVVVEPHHIEANKAERRGRLERLPQQFREAQEELLDEIPFTEFFPAFTAAHVDRVGNIWVQDYEIPGDEQKRFMVFNPEGILLGPVTMPMDLQVFEIGNDYVLGRMSDDLDIEHVIMYGLNKWTDTNEGE